MIDAGTDLAVETAGVVLMNSDPASVATAIVLAIPFAAGALYPACGVLLRPEWAALLLSAATVIVTANALLIGRVGARLAHPFEVPTPLPA